MRQYLFPAVFFFISLVIFFAPELSKLVKKAQIQVTPMDSSLESGQKSKTAERASLQTKQSREDYLAESFIRDEDWEILMSKEFKSAIKSTRREVKALTKRVEKTDLRLFSYLKAYETVLEKVRKFKSTDKRQASIVMNSLREIDSLVTQVILSANVDRDIARTWANLSLSPWITTSMIFRERLVVTTKYSPNIEIETLNVRFPSRKKIMKAYMAGEKIMPRLKIKFFVDDKTTQKLEVYALQSLVKTKKFKLKKKNLVKVSYKAPLGVHCFMFYDRFGESSYMCFDMARVLDFYQMGAKSVKLEKASWLPNGKFAKDLNSIFLVGSSDSHGSSGFVTF
ncbi:MAG: hypothetical protein NZT61_05110 [Deltaproteobacteria bacterium]|nr:hypothetical protein [Deltaproteobacteria bacterium]MCX7952645.1 hypothetical protein [Deltaproteobacteria bacterium]